MKFLSYTKLQELVGLLKERINAKVSKSGDSMTGNLTVGQAKIQTNGYLTGTWVQSTANLALNTAAKLFVVHHNGWFYTRTAEQIKQDLGIPDTFLDVTVENNKLIFYSGATVENNKLIVG